MVEKLAAVVVMKFVPMTCKACGEDAVGTCEVVRGTAMFDAPNPDGSVVYSGESEYDEGSGETETDAKGRTKLVCGNGHEWFARDVNASKTKKPRGKKAAAKKARK